jgi:peptidase M48-like protein/tellurite resistance protein TerB
VSILSESTSELMTAVFPPDRALRLQLLRDPEFAKVREEQNRAAEGSKRNRRKLLEGTIRLTQRMSPWLFKCLARVREALDLPVEIEVFCAQSSEIYAWAVPAEDRGILLVFANGTLERLEEGELAFVIGHELGHVLFDHLTMAEEVIAKHKSLSPLQKMRFFAWMRYAEVSADRIGMIACADLDIAVRALFKMTSGLTDPRFLAHVADACKQYVSLAGESLETYEDDWFATHPYSPFRMRALALFARSRRFQRLTRRPVNGVADRETDRQVAHVVEVMNPTFLHTKPRARKDAIEFLELATMALVAVGGEIKGEVVEAVEQLAGARDSTRRLDALRRLGPEQRTARVGELARALSIELSTMRRHKLVEDLVAVAMSDGRVNDREWDLLEATSRMLHVEVGFVSATISRLLRGLD